MLRGFGIRFTLLVALLAPVSIAAHAANAAGPDVKLPPGTRQDGDHYVAGRGLRDSTDFIRKELAKRGIAAEQIGPYRARGVELTRFISQLPSTTWLAIHVVRVAGKTLIFFVPRPKP
jgi:hypothetical protein